MIRRPRLDSEADKFWDRHAKRCQEEGSLTDATFDAFTLLARTWSLLANLDPAQDERTGIMKFNGLAKQFREMATPFGLFSKKPTPKKKTIKDIIKSAEKNS